MSSQTTSTLTSTKPERASTQPISISTGRYVCPNRRSRDETPSFSSTPSWRRGSSKSSPSSASSWRRGSDSSESDSPSVSSSPATTNRSSPSSSPPTRALQSTNWRTSTPKVDTDVDKVINPRPGEVQRLPAKSEVGPDSIFFKRQMHRQDNPWEHPVVILDVCPNDTVRCRLLGTLGGKKLQNKLEHERLKIALCENDEGVKAYVGTRILTVEAGSEKFGKATYCNFYDQECADGTFVIEISNLRTWRTNSGKPILLSKESVLRIKNKQVH